MPKQTTRIVTQGGDDGEADDGATIRETDTSPVMETRNRERTTVLQNMIYRGEK